MSTATIRVFAFSCSICLALTPVSAQDPPARGTPPAQEPAPEITIPAGPDQGPVREISLEDAVRLGLLNNTTLSAAKLVPQQARQNLKVAKAFFEPELFSELGYSDTATPTLNVFQPSLERERVNGNFGWRNRLATGGLLDMAFSASRLNQTTSTPGFPETQFTTELTLTVTQPLLRGAWSDYNLQDVRIAEADLAGSGHDLEQVVQDTILAMVEAYWELVFARENYRVVYRAHDVAREQLRITMERIRVQTLAERDRFSDEAEVARQQENLIVALNEIRSREDILRRLILDDQLGGIWYSSLRPTSPAEIAPEIEELQWRPLARIARQNRPDLRALVTDVTVAEVQFLAAKNEMLPQLDLVTSYSTEGVDSTFSSGLSGTTGLDFPDWSLRLEFVMPIGNSAAIATAASAELNLEYARRILYGAEMDVDLEVRDSARQLHTLAQSIEASRSSVTFGEVTLETEQIKLRVGDSTAFEVQSRNQELLEARSRLLRNQLDYRIEQSRLLHVQGILRGPGGPEDPEPDRGL